MLQKMFNECAKVLNKAAYEDWELSQLETELKQVWTDRIIKDDVLNTLFKGINIL